MKKILIIFAICIFVMAGSVHAKVQEMVKQLDDLKVTIAMDMTKHNEDGHHSSEEEEQHNSLGGNKVDITIHDSAGNVVNNAKVKISYSMASRANMPPMKYTARAKSDGDSYKAVLNFSMSGEWDITVYIQRPGKGLDKVEFNMHVM